MCSQRAVRGPLFESPLRDEMAAGSLPMTRSLGSSPGGSNGAGKTTCPPRGTTSWVVSRDSQVKRALAMTRLLTLYGAGGWGKRRLALEVARDLVSTTQTGCGW